MFYHLIRGLSTAECHGMFVRNGRANPLLEIFTDTSNIITWFGALSPAFAIFIVNSKKSKKSDDQKDEEHK